MDPRIVPASLLAALFFLPLAEARAQQPAWAERTAFDVVDFEAGTFDPAIGRPMALASSFGRGSMGPRIEFDGINWVYRVQSNVPVTTSVDLTGTKLTYDARRNIAVWVRAGTPPVTREWNGSDWVIATTPTSLPPTSCISSLSWNQAALEVQATVGGQIWGYDGTDWHYRGALPFDPNYGLWVPPINMQLFGLRSGPWDGSGMVAWNGLYAVPVTFTGAGPSNPFGLGLRVVFDEAGSRLVAALPGASTLAGTVTSGVNGINIHWTDLLTALPSNRCGNMVYDSARARVVYFGGLSLNDTWELANSSNTWTHKPRITDSPQPTARTGVDLVFDASRQQCVMFGGEDAANPHNNDTWTYDGYRWTSFPAFPGVPGRSQAALTYVGSTGRVLMFGGLSTAALGDFKSWQGAAWGNQSSSTPLPPARYGHCMVWDEARDRVVLFGGNSNPSTLLNDTWEFDPPTRSWQQIFVNAPAPRTQARMVYDRQHQQIVMFGGIAASLFDDTWSYTDPTTNGWLRMNPPTHPTARANHMMQYDPKRNRIVLFGGFGYGPCGTPACTSSLADHWEFDSQTWVQRPSGPATAPGVISTALPPQRMGAGMAYDPVRQRMVLFGGADGLTYRGDTWNFDSGSDSFGRGQALGGIRLHNTLPAIAGNDLAFEFDNASSFGWLAIHLETVPNPTHFADPPLACTSRAWFYGLQPIVANVFGNPGRLRFNLPPWLLGYGLNFQAIALDTTGPCLRVSDPLAMTVQGL